MFIYLHDIISVDLLKSVYDVIGVGLSNSNEPAVTLVKTKHGLSELNKQITNNRSEIRRPVSTCTIDNDICLSLADDTDSGSNAVITRQDLIERPNILRICQQQLTAQSSSSSMFSGTFFTLYFPDNLNAI